MPRTRSLAFSELKIGLLSVIAILVAASVIFLLSGTGGFSWQRYSLKTRFSEVAGLKTGAPVRVAGVEVGSVKAIEFVGDEVEVTFELSKRMQSRVTTQSLASLGSLSLLGQTTVDVSPASQGQPIPPWGYVKSGRAPGQLADVAMSATEGLQEATALIHNLRQGQGSIGKLLTDDRLYGELTSFVSAANQVADAVKRGRGTAGKLVTDPAVYDELKTSVTRLNTMLARVNEGQGSLGRLLNDEQMGRSLGQATANIGQVTEKLNRGDGSLGKLVNDAALYNRLTSVADHLDQLTANLDKGEGSAGQLLHDRQLYENMNGAASELRGLIAEIKKNPRKYLSIKVSVF